MAFNQDKMSALDRYRLEFCEQLDIDLMLVYLTGDFLKEHHIDLVKGKKTKFLQRAQLLDIIKQRGETAFTAFVQGLLSDTVHQPHLANLIKNAHQIQGNLPVEMENRHRNPSGNAVGSEYPPNDPKIYPLNGQNFYISSNTQQLSAEEIALQNQKNAQFYAAEIRAFNRVAETEGVLENNEVIDVVDGNKATRMYNEGIDIIYPNFSKPKGLAIVFNNQDFDVTSIYPRRLGTERDKTNIVRLFQGLGYSVKVKENLSALDMTKALSRFAQEPEHKVCDSAVVVILTHGKEGHIIGSDGIGVDVNAFLQLLNAANCPALKNKPKLFFIQACRGDREDDGHILSDGNVERDGNSKSQPKSSQNDIPVDQLLQRLQHMDMTEARNIQKKIPTEADFLIAYATTPGYVSWRHKDHGSWFIQAICQVFAAHANDWDITQMLIKVNNRVATAFRANGKVQMPDPHIRLLKHFYFFPGVHK